MSIIYLKDKLYVDFPTAASLIYQPWGKIIIHLFVFVTKFF